MVALNRSDVSNFIDSQKGFLSRMSKMMKMDASELKEALEGKTLRLNLMTAAHYELADKYRDLKKECKVICMHTPCDAHCTFLCRMHI